MSEIEWSVEPSAAPSTFTPTAPVGPVSPLRTFRDTMLAKVPPWLQRGLGGKISYTAGLHLDGFTDALVAGVKSRFPGLYSDESLPYLGRDRRIRRGRTETNAVYASRLIRWLDDHRRRGGPYAMLYQLFAHYAPSNFPIHLVYQSGRRFIMDASGDIERDEAWPLVNQANWANWKLFFFNGSSHTSDGIWSDPGTWSDGGVWDSTLTVDEVTDIRLVPREWNAAHCKGSIVLINNTIELWDYPQGIWSDPGVWGGVDDFPPTISVE